MKNKEQFIQDELVIAFAAGLPAKLEGVFCGAMVRALMLRAEQLQPKALIDPSIYDTPDQYRSRVEILTAEKITTPEQLEATYQAACKGLTRDKVALILSLRNLGLDALDKRYAELEHEHLGCSVAKTGIYADKLDAAGEPKLEPTVLEQAMVRALNSAKAWINADVPGAILFPRDTLMEIDAALMLYEARRVQRNG